ncbi:MAG: hypothetical protein LKG79_07410 [Furfurilactobacillus sp.]|jgi:hypothetical protein|uniref:hypothetical protein n=1 Tax=Furfurilactobacillus sp. TaxID=2767911 RepID=UPI0025870564|nr:hypothetical protein [Furfurilactobacillus sp.]MCH4010574.1 hypothetical protein [Furfurilactobacillus sp.]MCH4036466.1 hypothetical protein [Furfurilactobacillus sp.]MCH4114588.1 hypothetical protein [Furfurilactobacillus sp.]MCH4133793.1 hypothetical protein [Furfurilactobacillus sp.]MCI1340170.1 hypothetical protein [Furfurilactobacillus sp.]
MNNKQKLPNDVQAADHNLSTLNDHLFDELDRLGDESLTGEEIAKETARAKAVAGIANVVVNNAQVVLSAQRLYGDDLAVGAQKPKMLE